MLKLRWTGYITCILLCLHLSAQAQPADTTIPFVEWIKNVEAKTSYHFYYQSKDVDSIAVSEVYDPDNISGLLSEIFKNSPLHYTIVDTVIFITSAWKIEAGLPPDFFIYPPESEQESEFSAPGKTTSTPDQIIVDYFGEDKITAKGKDLKVIGIRTNFIKKGSSRITGRVTAAKNGEPIVGASILLNEPRRGVSTDPLGYYSITVPNGKQQLTFSSMGMRTVIQEVVVYGDGELNIEMHETIQSLQEVVVSAGRNEQLKRAEMGIENLAVKDIQQIPSALGEVDIIKAVITLPGVKTVGEASSGFNVRGGSTDQNLILYNNAPIYNPSHLFGFFSAFNPDVLSGVQLYKASIPAEYGGRLSSVLDITSREGNKKKYVVAGGIGLVTGRLTVEGPIVKEQTSFILGARSNYSNWVLKRLENNAYSQSKAQFYDLDLGLSHQVNERNKLFFNAYYSSDYFRFKADTSYRYQNQLSSLRWKHIFSDKMYSNISVAQSRYNYSVSSERNPQTAFDLRFKINQYSLNANFNYFLNARHNLKFGGSTQLYKLSPGSLLPASESSIVEADILQSEQALESALHLSDEYFITPELVLSAGLRYSLFNHLGPGEITTYAPDFAPSEYSIADTLYYDKNENIQTYGGPEFRLALRFRLNDYSSVKLSYNTLRQYLHMLSNTAAISPTDVWKLSDTHIRPQFGQQLSLGYYRNLWQGKIETSVEVYARKFDHYLDYRSGAQLIMNHNIEREVINTEGRSYGVELMIKKTTGKLNGWLSYTYSRSLIRQQDPLVPEQINDGNWYPTNFDKPHDITLVGNYRFTHRYSFSMNFTYSTGRPITLPIAKYYYDGSQRVLYSERNEYRIPDYYRLDIGLNVEGNHKVKKLLHSSWSFSVYNLLGRKNPYSVYFASRDGNIQGYKLSIFGRAIPTITYNFHF